MQPYYVTFRPRPKDKDICKHKFTIQSGTDVLSAGTFSGTATVSYADLAENYKMMKVSVR